MVKKTIQMVPGSRKKNIFVGTGMSQQEDPVKATQEALTQALKSMKEGVPHFAIIYASAAKYGDRKNMESIAKTFDRALKDLNPACEWVGASSKREISNYGYTENSIVVMVIQSKFVHFGIGVGKGVNKSPEKAGRDAASNAVNDVKIDNYLDPYLHFTAIKNKKVKDILTTKPYFFMTLFPGVTGTFMPKDNAVFKGITSITGVHTFFGGDASDNWTFSQTYVMANGKVYTDAAIVVCIVSNLKMGVGVKHGYRKTGNIVVVTKAKGNVVYEINNKPAAEYYSELVNIPLDQLKENMLPALTKFPFGVADIEGEYWLNCPYAVVEDTALGFFEPMVEGTAICIMEADKPKIINSAEEAIKRATFNLKEIEGLIVFSCSARLFYLGKDIEQEFRLVKKVIKNKPFIGFCSYAEHATIPSGPVYKHGYTFVCFGITNKLISE